MKNFIGIEKDKAELLSKELNGLLSEYQVFYQNLRGFHWNLKGTKFFELHVKFEEFYNDANLKIDEIAERILTLGGQPLHTFEKYLEHATIQSETNVTEGIKGAQITMDNFSTLIQLERKILTLAGEAEDEGTMSLMSDYITETEKTLWMLNSFLG